MLTPLSSALPSLAVLFIVQTQPEAGQKKMRFVRVKAEPRMDQGVRVSGGQRTVIKTECFISNIVLIFAISQNINRNI